MGLFSKKAPCAICGGKVSGLFPWKVEGQLVCSECHGMTDLPDDMERNLTLDEFKEYRKFREENQQLKEEFVITDTVDFGWFDTKIVFDTEHQLFCFDKNLNKTIFEGAQLKSFTIKEDSALLYKGSADALMRYTSRVPEMARAMAPQIMQYIAEQEIQQRLDSLADRDMNKDGSTDYHRPPRHFLDLSEPFKEFNVELTFKHPYWKTMKCDMTGPTFSMDRPNISDYLMEYEDCIERIEMLVHALMAVAFPEAPERSDDDEICNFLTSPAEAPKAADPTTEIRKYKELLADGIITEEEFAVKKRQLMGI